MAVPTTTSVEAEMCQLSCQQQPVLRQRKAIYVFARLNAVTSWQRSAEPLSLYQPATSLGPFEPPATMLAVSHPPSSGP